MRYICGMIASFALVVTVFAENQDTRIRLLFSTVETPDTRTDSLQDTVQPPQLNIPHSAADMQAMKGDELQQAKWENAAAIREHNRLIGDICWQEYQRRVKRQDDIMKKANATQMGRILILMRDWFAASMSPYDDIFVSVFRVDGETARKETFFDGREEMDVETSTYFIKLIVNDPHQKSSKIYTQGGGTLEKTTTSLVITVQVQDMQNRMIFTRNVEESIVEGSSSAKATSGSDDVLGRLTRKCLEKAAKEVADKFSVQLTVKVKGPKGDKDFDAEDATITVNGSEVSHNSPQRYPKGKYTIAVEMDGYETSEKEYDLSTSSGNVTKTITLKKEKAGEE